MKKFNLFTVTAFLSGLLLIVGSMGASAQSQNSSDMGSDPSMVSTNNTATNSVDNSTTPTRDNAGGGRTSTVGY
jgi:hypothetical protein